MKKLGIFLGYTPRQLVPHEGITRLLGFIVRGAVKSGDISVTIAGPAWLKTDIINLLDDAGVPAGSVDIITTKGEPYLIKLWRVWTKIFHRPRSKKPKRTRLFKYLAAGTRLIVDWLSNSSFFVFFFGVLLLIILATIFALPLLISISLVTLVYVGKKLSSRFRTNRYFRAKNWFMARLYYLLNTVGPLDTVQSHELNRLVKLLNKRRDIDVWYVPSMFWPEISGLRGNVVMAAPDIVFYEHPAQYITPADMRMLDRISKSIAGADRLITYSDHVKTNHIVNRHHVNPNRVTVIRHGFVDMASIERGNGTRQDALDVLHKYLKQKEDSLPEYLHDFRFDDVKFLFYSSQVRPHKNVEALITVFERVLRENYRPVKLILTGRTTGIERIRKLIEDRGLQRDVISLPSVPNYVLASLYRLAVLSITPTQFEGGFPFTFSEAYSVGTPSIMSRIPVVTEIIQDQELLDVMTFDPQDREEMLQKILWGLDNDQTLLTAQKSLFETMSLRSWDNVANEYLDLILRSATEQKKPRLQGREPKR
ncbi:glycosyltransferase [Mesorhizobium sp. B2-6-1]|uniref:glycosyltransferase n=1 Tax=Mesorhizobium sp. B2-6-1 TaxID=2589916 RepID=UPI00112873F0|nr:glycosyltransferase [Mesorhizobium sp. B2-6-1]TPJ65345.1 glycosyltransferase family 4 protein [Mesorhizobium sp. B2-6-1]